jgi:polyhydroxyalkanoate synthase
MTERRRTDPEPDAVDSTLVLNPVVGLRTEDMLRTARDLLSRALLQPGVVLEQTARLWQDGARILLGQSELAPEESDKRFAHRAWQKNALYRNALQGWIAWHQSLRGFVEGSGLDEIEARRSAFLVDLIADALAPTNFLVGNPAALERALETGGTSLIQGLRHYLDDLLTNQGMPSQVDKSQFEVGRNVASTPGSVVHRSKLFELVQYAPTTDKVFEKPIVIVPPQINKYYVYDISPDKSFVAHAVAQGLQTFILSWRNPTPEHRHWGLDDYVGAVEEGIEAALEITGQETLNGVGACAGGITFAATLGHLQATRRPLVDSITLMVNVLVNETSDSVLGLFVDENTIENARKRSASRGVLDGSDMARVFSWMRPNDLIWNYVVSNYLLGEKPPAFDILYWNSDSTRLPAKLHSDFLEVFEKNPFREPGALVVRGEPIDLKATTCDAYITGGTTDHITPWQACYRSTQLFGGDVTYVLSTAGHIQSIVNPPKGSKRKYLLNPELPEAADEWLAGATEHPGSWWTHWYEWIGARSGAQRPAPRALGSKTHPVLAPAPGSYVRE